MNNRNLNICRSSRVATIVNLIELSRDEFTECLRNDKKPQVPLHLILISRLLKKHNASRNFNQQNPRLAIYFDFSYTNIRDD